MLDSLLHLFIYYFKLLSTTFQFADRRVWLLNCKRPTDSSQVLTLRGTSCDSWRLLELHSLWVTGMIFPSPPKMQYKVCILPTTHTFPRVHSSTCYEFRWKATVWHAYALFRYPGTRFCYLKFSWGSGRNLQVKQIESGKYDGNVKQSVCLCACLHLFHGFELTQQSHFLLLASSVRHKHTGRI